MATEYTSVEDELNAMINGNHQSNESTTIEDPETTEETEATVDTTPELDGEMEDTTETKDLEVEGTAQVDDQVEEGTDTEIEESEASEETKETVKTVDYEKEYKELQEKSATALEFYDKLSKAEFKANGKIVKSITDADKLVQVQQMAHGLNEKFKAIKPLRKYTGALEQRGMLQDEEKFNLAMAIMDGDKEALKTHIKSLDIDTLDLDMDNIDYKAESKTLSDDTVMFEEVLDSAKMLGGIEAVNKVKQVVLNEWDDKSYNIFREDPLVRSDLIAHINDGTYDIVQKHIAERSLLDNNFSSLSSIDQYRQSIVELSQSATTETTPNTEPEVKPEITKKVESVGQTKEEIIAEFKAQQEKEMKADKARKAAARASKSKSKKATSDTIDPMKLAPKDISSYLDNMILGR